MIRAIILLAVAFRRKLRRRLLDYSLSLYQLARNSLDFFHSHSGLRSYIHASVA
jgi:hypothetical protein